MSGKLLIGDQLLQLHTRFRDIADYEAFFSIDEGYEADHDIFKGYFCKVNTPQFNLVKRSQYRNGFDFQLEIFEYRGINFFIPTKCYCFVKCINYLNNCDYTEQYPDFISDEKRRSNVITMACIQPCLRNSGINLGYYNGKKFGQEKFLKEIKLCLYTVITFVYYGNQKVLVLIKLLKN